MTVGLATLAGVVPDEIVRRIGSARRVVTVCHEHPEADALGAALAVALLVEARGGSAQPLCADPVPAMYDFLPGMDRFATAPSAGASPDLVVVVDCGELDRVGSLLQSHASLFADLPVVNIDHHVSNTGFGAASWVDPAAAATCEMVTLLAQRLGVPLTAFDGTLASALLAGVVMDTATFQHPNATPRTLIVAAALREAGAPLSEISRRLYRSKPDPQLVLFGRVLARMSSGPGGHVVWSRLEAADLAATGTTSEHSEGLIDLLAQSETAEVALLFREEGPATRLSIRTRTDGVDATALAALWGGGGHARAAGATVPLPLAEAEAAVLPEAERLAAAVAR